MPQEDVPIGHTCAEEWLKAEIRLEALEGKL